MENEYISILISAKEKRIRELNLSLVLEKNKLKIRNKSKFIYFISKSNRNDFPVVLFRWSFLPPSTDGNNQVGAAEDFDDLLEPC